MNASQHQEMDNATLESMLVCSKSPDPRKPRPQPEHALPCPRCESTNTKFCYYNNYSLTQPRYFCKSCRRYWTKGGTLRNVPVGGGCRKNKRSSSSSKRTPDPNSTSNPLTGLPPVLNYDADDQLSLAFARLQKSGGQLGFDNETEISGFIGNGTNCDAGFIGSGFLGNSISNFQNFCYGSGDGEMLVPNYQDSNLNLASMKQEFGSSGVRFDGNEQMKGMWSFPYHGGNNGSNNLGEFENGINGFNSSWHGLLNSPLM